MADAAKLFRVYPKVPPVDVSDPRRNAGALLELEAKMLRQQLEREQETVADLRARLDKADALITDGRPRQWFWQN